MKIKKFSIFDSFRPLLESERVVEARNRKEAVAKEYNVNMKAVRANSRGHLLVTEIELKDNQLYRRGRTIGYEVVNRV